MRFSFLMEIPGSFLLLAYEDNPSEVSMPQFNGFVCVFFIEFYIQLINERKNMYSLFLLHDAMLYLYL